MFEKAVEFIKNCRGKTVIIYDTDGDGIGAAVIVAKTLKRLFGKYPKAIPAYHDMFNATMESSYKKLSEGKDNIIIVDIAADAHPEYMLKLAKKHKILIIDHHQVKRNLNRVKNIVHVNSSFWKSKIKPSQYAASKMTFDICKKIADIEDMDWVAGLGIINDCSGPAWKDFLNKIYKKYPYLKGKNLYTFDNKLGYINNLITSGYFHSGIGAIKLGYKIYMKSESPMDVIKLKTEPAKKLKKMYDEIEEEMKCVMKNWKGEAEIFKNKNLIILELKTKFAIKSPISTKISMKNRNCTLVVARKSKDKMHVSFRRQDGKVDCGELARKSIKDLKNANGGGHAPAAAAVIMAKDWKKLKENIIRLL
ncbi:MAG: DHH family phosphoesterase [Candidatus Aenigmatarchaeota archaeon]